MPARPKSSGVDTAPLKRRAMMALAIQAFLLLVLVVAAFLARNAPFTAALYAWACVIPLGFAFVYFSAYRRGARVREERRWTLEFERGEAKRAYRWMGVVLLVWMVGLVGVYAAFSLR